jgi:hypothetical protein
MEGVSMVKVEDELSGFPAGSTCVVKTISERGGRQPDNGSTDANVIIRMYFKSSRGTTCRGDLLAGGKFTQRLATSPAALRKDMIFLITSLYIV